MFTAYLTLPCEKARLSALHLDVVCETASRPTNLALTDEWFNQAGELGRCRELIRKQAYELHQACAGCPKLADRTRIWTRLGDSVKKVTRSSAGISPGQPLSRAEFGSGQEPYRHETCYRRRSTPDKTTGCPSTARKGIRPMAIGELRYFGSAS